MKHATAIASLLAEFHEPWMSDEDKATLNAALLEAVGKTPEALDAEMETGIRNGLPLEKQMALAKALIHSSRPSRTA